MYCKCVHHFQSVITSLTAQQKTLINKGLKFSISIYKIILFEKDNYSRQLVGELF